jgi:nucleoid-associated protein YgaU
MPRAAAPRPAVAALRLATALGALAAVVAVLHAAGGALPAPPWTDPGGWSAWAAGDPLAAAFGVVRVAALAAAWWVLGTTVLALAARALRWRTVLALTDRLVVPALRRSVQGALGVGLVAATLAGPVRPVAADPWPAPAAATAVAGEGSAVELTVAAVAAEAPAAAPGSATLRRLAAAPASSGTATLRLLPPGPAEEHAGGGTAHLRRLEAGPAASRPEAAEATHRVGSGEHFWSIAADVVRDALGRPGDEVEVGRYWDALLAANRDRLADPANPDLVFPGQALRLPPVVAG